MVCGDASHPTRPVEAHVATLAATLPVCMHVDRQPRAPMSVPPANSAYGFGEQLTAGSAAREGSWFCTRPRGPSVSGRVTAIPGDVKKLQLLSSPASQQNGKGDGASPPVGQSGPGCPCASPVSKSDLEGHLGPGEGGSHPWRRASRLCRAVTCEKWASP